MRAAGTCPKCQGQAIREFSSVRARGGPLSVGDFAADAFTMISQFTGYVCQTCGSTEFYRKG